MTGRVLHAGGVYGVPSETFIRDRIAALGRIGWDPWVTATALHETAEVPPELRGRLILPAGRRLRQRATDPLRRDRTGIAGRRLLADAVGRTAPDVVHAHFGWIATYALAPARSAAVPLVPSFHGADVTAWPYERGRLGRPERLARYATLFAAVPRVLAVSDFLAHHLRELGYDGDIHVVPSGTAVERFPFRGPRNAAGEELRLLHVGRLVPRKGLAVALRALVDVRRHVPNTRLDVIGAGGEEAALRALAARLRLDRAVRFLGACSHDAVGVALQDADIVLVPSRTDGRLYESLGNVAKEAFAVGLEVVATDHGGIPETFPPERRGELVPEDDAAALADRILDVAGRRPAWGERADRARAWVEERFDYAMVARRIAGVYALTIDDPWR